MDLKDELNILGWSIKTEFFEGNTQSRDSIKELLLNVRTLFLLRLLFSIHLIE